MKKESVNGRTLLVWDSEEALPSVRDGFFAVLWRGFIDGTSSDVVSIPALVEMHGDELRTRYLAWIYDLGEMRIQDRRLVDWLELRPGLSYWWMTPFTEKCNYSKSPQIADAIRLMAFENWAADQVIARVVLVSASQALAECIRSWCTSLGVVFEFQDMTKTADKLPLVRRMYKSLPDSLQALTWLLHRLTDSWGQRGVGISEWRMTEGRMAFFSYLFNLEPRALENGRFESRYWAHLPDDLQRDGSKTNWLHLHLKSALLPTPASASDAIREFNKSGQGGQVHVTLDTFLDVRVVVRTLLDWGHLACSATRLQPAVFSSKKGVIDLWPLFRKEWQMSMRGRAAMQTLLNYNLFESALRQLPTQKGGVYLQENQGWEFALIAAWKLAGHGRLIGAPHSSVRYWDLRYFFDPRSYLRTGNNDLPLPDQVAINGPEAMNVYLASGYRKSDLVDVEALRFLYLSESSRDVTSDRSSVSQVLRVLVLGEYLLSNTQLQMRLLEKAVHYLPGGTIITVKPHPACPIQPADYPGVSMDVTMDPVSKLLAKCDVAYTSAVTSAAIDAYCAGVPVVSVLDPNTLNLSPLRGHTGVLFASTPEELAESLVSAASTPRLRVGIQTFFTLDPQLPRWRKLLLECIE